LSAHDPQALELRSALTGGLTVDPHDLAGRADNDAGLQVNLEVALVQARLPE
jgi:hypothetical protein